jgi:hypothetical protein
MESYNQPRCWESNKILKKGSPRTYNPILKRVYATIVAVEEQ